jgi:hypothetical protein
MTTTLFHATVISGGPSGLSFQIGDSLLFAPMEGEQLYLIDNPALLLVSAPVPAGMADFLTQTVIEPRLAQIGGEL